MPPSIAEYVGRVAAQGRRTGGRKLSQADAPDRTAVVTVVTPTFNSIRTIDAAIDSIAAQTFPSVEYIVIDGGSQDGTVERLGERSHDIDLWISEPDQGIGDAFNKGIALATGAYVALVNSDDWLEPRHISVALERLRATGADFVYGDLMFHPADGEPPYLILGEGNYGRRLAHTMPDINHPTVVCKRSLYEMHGLYDTRLRVAMDYEWFLRGYKQGVRGVHVPGMKTHMSMEGVSQHRYSQGLAEVRDVSVLYGYPRLLAGLRFAIRVRSLRVRWFLQRWVPRQAYEWLRRRINPHYRSLGTGST